jgi:ParB family chromosome partitioning protein
MLKSPRMQPEHSAFHNNAVFFVEVEKIKPNPFQPRREFDEGKLEDLADSIRTYGVLQPLVVTRREVVKDDGGIGTEYELIAGERRLRASKLAGVREVPVLIRAREDSDRMKLELAIIENLQREDLNPVDRAKSFKQLAEQFGLKHHEIAAKVGKSREYVSNSIRLLALPAEIIEALTKGEITEGHARPLLMLGDRPEEQGVLYREILQRRMTVREAERIGRKIAYDKVRKKERQYAPEIVELEEEVGEILGTRVYIEPKEVGGNIRIDFFSDEDLQNILGLIRRSRAGAIPPALAAAAAGEMPLPTETPMTPEDAQIAQNDVPPAEAEKNANDDDLYAVGGFTV